VVDEEHLLVLPVVDLAGHGEDQVLPRLRLDAAASRLERGVRFAVAGVPPLGTPVLEVFGGMGVDQRRREHRVGVARRDRECLSADDDRIVSGEIPHELEPARLVRRREDLRDQRVERARRGRRRRRREVRSVRHARRQRDARDALERGVGLHARQLDLRTGGEEVEIGLGSQVVDRGALDLGRDEPRLVMEQVHPLAAVRILDDRRDAAQ
jgi:hypothetical protein